MVDRSLTTKVLRQDDHVDPDPVFNFLANPAFPSVADHCLEMTAYQEPAQFHYVPHAYWLQKPTIPTPFSKKQCFPLKYVLVSG